MSIVVQYTPSSNTGTGPSVQDIITEVSQDIRRLLADSGSDATILLNYVNRVQLDICRASRWNFLLSAPQRFVTSLEATDYWIGAAGSATVATVDTLLDLSDLDYVKADSVFDRTNSRRLSKVSYPPNNLAWQFPDSQSRKSNPINFRHDREDNSDVINLYPAPDNACGYQIVPEAPICSSVTSGALAGRTYYVRLAYSDVAGNIGAASDTSKVYVSDNQVLTVRAPKLPFNTTSGNYDISDGAYRIFVGTASGSETLQAQVSYGVDWQEPNTGLLPASSFPLTNPYPSSTSELDVIGGYIIEFRYYKKRPQLANLADTLLVPWDYKDVVIAGTNALASQYLKLTDDSKFWSEVYQQGLAGMLRDKNLFPKSSGDFIRPAVY